MPLFPEGRDPLGPAPKPTIADMAAGRHEHAQRHEAYLQRVETQQALELMVFMGLGLLAALLLIMIFVRRRAVGRFLARRVGRPAEDAVVVVGAVALRTGRRLQVWRRRVWSRVEVRADAVERAGVDVQDAPGPRVAGRRWTNMAG